MLYQTSHFSSMLNHFMIVSGGGSGETHHLKISRAAIVILGLGSLFFNLANGSSQTVHELTGSLIRLDYRQTQNGFRFAASTFIKSCYIFKLIYLCLKEPEKAFQKSVEIEEKSFQQIERWNIKPVILNHDYGRMGRRIMRAITHLSLIISILAILTGDLAIYPFVLRDKGALKIAICKYLLSIPLLSIYSVYSVFNGRCLNNGSF